MTDEFDHKDWVLKIAAEMMLNGKEISGVKRILEFGYGKDELELVRSMVHEYCPNPGAMDYFIDRAWENVTR